MPFPSCILIRLSCRLSRLNVMHEVVVVDQVKIPMFFFGFFLMRTYPDFMMQTFWGGAIHVPTLYR